MNILNKLLNPYFLYIIFFLSILIFSSYWIKNKLDINIFNSYSLSKFIPFKYLKRDDSIPFSETSTLFYDSFDSNSIFPKWSKLWMREKGKVSNFYDLNEIDNSLCLLIKSKSSKSWSYSNNKYIEVRKGDIIYFKVNIKINGKQSIAYAGFSSFNKNKYKIDWNYIREKMAVIDKWVKIEKNFMITDTTNYIKFKISGTGIGEYRFDNIIIRRL